MKSINPKKDYSKHSIVQGEWLGKHPATVQKKIDRDRLGANLLKVRIDEKGYYHILGANLIKYLKAQEV